MKTQTALARGSAHSAHASQLFTVIFLILLAPAVKSFAQNSVLAQNSAEPRLLNAGLAGGWLANSAAPEDEFQAEAAPHETASNHMAGLPAEVLPCEEHARINENDSIPAAAGTPQAPVVLEENSAHLDQVLLVDKIQAVQRMIKLMELKEEIMREKARFEKELVDLQRKIGNH